MNVHFISLMMNTSSCAIRCNMENDKIDPALGLALQLPEEERQKSESLSSGFSFTTDTWEVLLRVAGSLETLRDKYPEAFFRELSGGYVIGLVPEEEVSNLAEESEVIYVEQPKRLQTEVNQGVQASCITPLHEGITRAGTLTGTGVLVAVIDSGIDYFHPDFRNEDGTTRIAWIWDDGVEYSREQINEALRQSTRKEALALVPTQDPSGHGTHVAGIAAGNGRASDGRYLGVAYESTLIVVKLGNARPGGFPKTTQLMEGVEYVKNKAQGMGLPVAINISFGNNYGSHTGESLLETYLSQMANQWQMSIVVGTGNEGNTALHRQGRLTSNQQVEIEIAIDAFESNVNLQLWKNYQDEMDIVLLAPDGQEVIRYVRGQSEMAQGVAGDATSGVLSGTWQNTTVYLYPGFPSPYTIYEEFFYAFLPRESYLDGGVWSIRLQSRAVKDGNFAMWLPSGGVLNFRTGFLNPSQETSLTIPSTAGNVISVGAYDSRRNQYASFSGRGYTWELSQVKPDLVAPGVDIVSCAVGGGYQMRSGTSMAAPFVTGTTALLMQWGIVEKNDLFLYGEKVKAYLLRGAKPLYQESMPSPKTGWGKLCAADAIPR